MMEVKIEIRNHIEAEELVYPPAASFGIGTHLTNDFALASDPTKSSKPLNIVIKLRKIDGLECVKLSDDRGKWTGNEQEVQRCRQVLGLEDE